MTDQRVPLGPGPSSPTVSDVLAPEGFPVASTPREAERLLRDPQARALGRMAESPTEIAWPGWRAVIRRTLIEMLTDRVALVAAGCAFYGTLALFPAISMLISVYGLLFDATTVLPQLDVLQDVLPRPAFQLISERVQMLVSNPPGTLTTRLLFSTAVTLWSAATGAKSIIGALNLAYEEREARSFVRYQLVSFTITLCVIGGTVVGLGLLIAMPPALTFFGFEAHEKILFRVGSFSMLVAAVMVGLSLLYRYGPSRAVPRWVWVTPGSILATVIWVLASALFSFYVATFASYDATYGSLGAVVAVMMWFYVTAYAVLLGAELNAELELQTERDSTDGTAMPLGSRGAYVADHVAEETRR